MCKDLPLRKKDRGPLSWYFVITLLVIIAYGLVVLFSASYSVSYQESGNSFSQINQQLGFAIAGIIIMFGISMTDYRALRHLNWYLYVFTLLLLAAALVKQQPHQPERQVLSLGGSCRRYLSAVRAGQIFHHSRGRRSL